MKQKEELRGSYILNALHDVDMRGDAYVSADELYQLCQRERRGLSTDAFLADKAFLMSRNKLAQEGRRIYQKRTFDYENAAAKVLADILPVNDLRAVDTPTDLPAGTTDLTGEQCAAIDMALSHRLSLILGGAGTGKTTLIQTLACRYDGPLPGIVLCAPTGKAAQNLTQRTGFPARTVHGALGLCPDENFLEPVSWPHTGLVVVDEASMLSLEMLAGILNVVSPLAHVVLVGDPNQLLSVGAGNVLPDLLALGFPRIQLTICHRQSADAEALLYNVLQFRDCRSAWDLHFDNSFYFVPQLNEALIRQAVCTGAAKYDRAGASVQVLSPYREAGKLSVAGLNRDIRELVNPATEANQNPDFPDAFFREGDRVMVKKNDWNQGVCNGDIGRFVFPGPSPTLYGIHCTDGRRAVWYDGYPKTMLELAYAVTVHKAQGSEYDMVILPLTKRFSVMLTRNLLYTAISRAKRHVVLVGDPAALELALQREPRPRKSMLVTKVRMFQVRAA